MFDYTTKSGRLTVREGLNGFYIYNETTNECRGMGDNPFEHLDNGCGEIQYQHIREEIERDEEVYLEAYFG